MLAEAISRARVEDDDAVARTVRAAAARVPSLAARLAAAGIDAAAIRGAADLARLPVLSKDQLHALQRADPPFGGVVAKDADLRKLFCSPGPLYEPQLGGPDPWRWAPALRAIGVGAADRVLNCFSYHLSPAGAMMEEGCLAVGASVIPGGVGNPDLQVQVAAEVGATAYIGLPSYLKALIEKAAERGLAWGIRKALVTGEPLPDSLRAALAAHVPVVLQSYGTAEAGLIGFETAAGSGLKVPPGILVEVCDLDSGEPRVDDKLGQVVVTVLRPDLGLVRFGTGDLSAWTAGEGGVARLAGVLGRMGEAVKVRGMFLHPRQAAAAMAAVPGVRGYRFVVRRAEHQDNLACEVVAAEGADPTVLAGSVRERIRSELRLNAGVEVVASLPEGGKTIVDERDWK